MAKSQKTKKFKLNPLAVVALVLCALIAVYCGTTAWLSGGAPVNPIRFFALEDFEYSISVNGSTDSTGVVTFNKDSIADLGNLEVSITQAGSGIAYTRVRITHEWKDKDGNRLQSSSELPLIINEEAGLFDNTASDGYIYYEGVFPVNEAVEIISGVDMTSLDTSSMGDATLSVNVTVDAVQFNRYQQLWKIDELPW